MPVLVVALVISCAVHGTLLGASYFLRWPSTPDTPPRIQLAQGRQPIRVKLVPAPTPDVTEVDEVEVTVSEESDTDRPPDEPEPVQVAPPGVDREPDVTDVPPKESNDQTTEQTDAVQEEKQDDAPLEQPIAAPVETPDRPRTVDVPDAQAPEPTPRPPSQRPITAPPIARVAPPVRPAARPRVRPVQPADEQAGVETGIKILDLPRPRYPIVSRRLGEQGRVLLKVTVLPNGRAGAIEVLKGPGFPRLIRAAEAAVRKAKFRPATRHGRPVKATVRIPFRFVLE